VIHPGLPYLEVIPVVAGGAALGLTEIVALFLLAIAYLIARTGLPGSDRAAAAIRGAGQGLQSWINGAVQAMMGQFNAWLEQARAQRWNSLAASSNGMNASLQALLNLQHRIIPNRVQSLTTNTDHARAQAFGHADGLHADAIRYAASTGQAARAYSAQLHQQGVAFSRELDLAERALALQLHQQGVAFTEATSQADQAQALQLHQAALAFTEQAVQAAEGYAAKIGADAQAYTDATARTLEGYIESVGANAAADTRAVTGAAVTPLAGALAVTEEAVNALRNSDCMKFCNPLGNLGAAMTAIDLGLLLGVVAEAARDPDQVRSELAAGASAVEGLVGDLVGLLGVR
jgi:hypothetical protein